MNTNTIPPRPRVWETPELEAKRSEAKLGMLVPELELLHLEIVALRREARTARQVLTDVKVQMRVSREARDLLKPRRDALKVLVNQLEVRGTTLEMRTQDVQRFHADGSSWTRAKDIGSPQEKDLALALFPPLPPV